MRKSAAVALVTALLLLGLALHGQAATTMRQVTLSAKTIPKIRMTIDAPAVDFGTLDPGVPVTKSPACAFTVRSNKSYLYVLSSPAAFTGGAGPDISHLEWDRLGAPPNGFLPCWEGDIDTHLFASKTSGRNYTYALRLTFGYDEDPEVQYSAELTATAMQW